MVARIEVELLLQTYIPRVTRLLRAPLGRRITSVTDTSKGRYVRRRSIRKPCKPWSQVPWPHRAIGCSYPTPEVSMMLSASTSAPSCIGSPVHRPFVSALPQNQRSKPDAQPIILTGSSLPKTKPAICITHYTRGNLRPISILSRIETWWFLRLTASGPHELPKGASHQGKFQTQTFPFAGDHRQNRRYVPLSQLQN